MTSYYGFRDFVCIKLKLLKNTNIWLYGTVFKHYSLFTVHYSLFFPYNSRPTI